MTTTTPTLLHLETTLESARSSEDLHAISRALRALGEYWQEHHRDKVALGYFVELLEVYSQLFPNGHSDITELCFTVGTLYRQQGDTRGLIQHYMKALNNSQLMHDHQDHSDIAVVYFKIGAVFKSIWRLEKACEFYQLAYEMSTRLFGDDDDNTAYLHKVLQDCKDDLSNTPLAIKRSSDI